MVKLRKRKINKSIIIILILFISIGFAALTSNLNILSNVTFLPQSFNIYFDNLQVNQNSSNLDNPTLSNDDTTVTFTSTINEPGDFYEFSFDVVNAGTMDAALDEIVKSGLTETQAQYLDYTAKYYGEREIHEDDILHAGYKEKIVVRVEYKYNIENVPSLGNVSFTFGLNYIKRDLQKDYGEETWSIEYTGSERTLTIPKTGIYRLETWGAQGGNGTTNRWDDNSAITYKGGYGGYSTGTISLSKNQSIYINSGGAGEDSIAGSEVTKSAGGYNGGGGCYQGQESGRVSTTGGGATHIATVHGLLSELNNQVSNILIVSGGGGGIYGDSGSLGYDSEGGSGGGYIGGYSIQDLTSCSSKCKTYNYPSGGTQSSGGLSIIDWSTGETSSTNYVGIFGAGGKGADNYGGGGAGFYGGASGNNTGGAGGSGYIGNTNLTNKVMYCYNCQDSTEEADETDIKTRSTTNHSEEPISYYAKEGNGFARITYLGNYSTSSCTVINYHPNGGEGSMDTQIITGNSTLNENKYTRDGYTFVGWSTTEKDLPNLIGSIDLKPDYVLKVNNTYYVDYLNNKQDTWIRFLPTETIQKNIAYTLMFNVNGVVGNDLIFGFPERQANQHNLHNGLNTYKFNTWPNDNVYSTTIGEKVWLDDESGNKDGDEQFYLSNFFLYKDSEVNYLDKANITYSSSTRTINLYALWAKVES